MISNLIISVEAVAPMFLIMLLGAFIKKIQLVNDDDVKKINKLVFKVFLPVLLFSNVYNKDISTAINVKLMTYSVVSVIVLYILTILVIVKIEKKPKNRGAMIQAIYRSNFVILGVPIVSNIFGGANLAVTSVIIAVVVPLYNLLAVIILEFYKGEKPKIGNVIFGVIKNPLIIGSVLGLLVSLTHISFPKFINSTISSIASVGTPLAIFILGASFNKSSLLNDKRNLIICVIGKIIIVPAIGITVGVLLGFRGIEIIILVALFASPTAVSSFTMAQQMDSNSELAGNAVIFSSIFSCFTIFICVFVLKTLEMF